MVSNYDTNCFQIHTENNKTLKNQNSSQDQAQTNICDTQSDIKQCLKTNTSNCKQDKEYQCNSRDMELLGNGYQKRICRMHKNYFKNGGIKSKDLQEDIGIERIEKIENT